MTIRFAANKTAGVKTVYVTGDSGSQYTVQFIRRAGMRRVSCSCPDFVYRGQLKRSHRACKHIKTVQTEIHNEVVNRRNARIEAEMNADREEFEGALSVSEMTRQTLESDHFAL